MRIWTRPAIFPRITVGILIRGEKRKREGAPLRRVYRVKNGYGIELGNAKKEADTARKWAPARLSKGCRATRKKRRGIALLCFLMQSFAVAMNVFDIAAEKFSGGHYNGV